MSSPSTPRSPSNPTASAPHGAAAWAPTATTARADDAAVRAFRTRLAAVQADLQQERELQREAARKESAHIAELEAEASRARARADAADVEARLATEEAARLRGRLAAAEAAREEAVMSLLAAKREAAGAAARAVLSAAAPLKTTEAAGGSDAASADAATAASEDDAAVVPTDAAHAAAQLAQLRRQLAAERRERAAVQTRLVAELGARTEAQAVLRTLIEQGRSDLDAQQRRVAAAGGEAGTAVRAPDAQSTAAGQPSAALPATADERRRMLAALLSHEHVLAALRAVVFPPPLPVEAWWPGVRRAAGGVEAQPAADGAACRQESGTRR